MVTTDNYMTAREVARLLRVSQSTCYRLLALGEIPARRVGRQYRINRADLDQRTRPAKARPMKRVRP